MDSKDICTSERIRQDQFWAGLHASDDDGGERQRPDIPPKLRWSKGGIGSK
jgi:hypothetical protein